VDEALASWPSRLGLSNDVASQSALREALAVAPEPLDEDSLRLLVAAETNAAGDARKVAERVAAAGGPSLATLAAVVATRAGTAPHPWHVLATVAKSMANLPLMSDDAYAGLAQVQAGQCRSEIAAEEAQKRFEAERAGQPLIESATWRALAEGTSLDGT
jgi:hypothetical protein